MTDRRTLHVEIGPPDQSNERPLKFRRDGLEVASCRRSGNALASLDTLSRLLSERNIALLRMIKSRRPRSVAELARLSGRPKASLTLTLRRLEKFGIIEFREIDGRRKVPTLVCDRLMLDLTIDTPDEPLTAEGRPGLRVVSSS